MGEGKNIMYSAVNIYQKNKLGMMMLLEWGGGKGIRGEGEQGAGFRDRKSSIRFPTMLAALSEENGKTILNHRTLNPGADLSCLERKV